MGPQINTNARKADVESGAFRTFKFEKILNNHNQDLDENFFNAFNFKFRNILLPKSPHELILSRVASQCYT